MRCSDVSLLRMKPPRHVGGILKLDYRVSLNAEIWKFLRSHCSQTVQFNWCLIPHSTVWKVSLVLICITAWKICQLTIAYMLARCILPIHDLYCTRCCLTMLEHHRILVTLTRWPKNLAQFVVRLITSSKLMLINVRTFLLPKSRENL